MAGLEEGTADVSFVGRDRELARVAGLLEARAGRGGLVLCTGEAGIGKTRFAEEIAATGAGGSANCGEPSCGRARPRLSFVQRHRRSARRDRAAASSTTG